MKKILLAVDGSAHSWKALEVAAELARAGGASVVCVHVVPLEPLPDGLKALADAENIPLEEEMGRWEEARRLGDAITREAADRLGRKGLKAVRTLVTEGNPASTIVELAREEGTDAVVIGSRGRSDVAGLLLGSVSHKVAHLAPCTCIIVR